MPDPRPAISVVIPAHNAERFLPDAIRSALEQSLPPLEVIVVDDGSTDCTAEVADGFGPPVRCVRQANAGPSVARNRGIREAAGEFIAFLDADDIWLPHHLEEAARVLRRHPQLQWFGAAFEMHYPGSRRVQRFAYESPLAEGAYINDWFQAEARQQVISADTVVIRADILRQVGGFDESMRYYEDFDLWFRIALKSPQVGYSTRISSIYWRQPASVTMTASMSTGSERSLQSLRKLEQLAAEAGESAVKQSRALIVSRVPHLILRAVKEGNQSVLREIEQRYGSELGLFHAELIRLSRIMPAVGIRTLYRLWEHLAPLRRILARRTRPI